MMLYLEGVSDLIHSGFFALHRKRPLTSAGPLVVPASPKATDHSPHIPRVKGFHYVAVIATFHARKLLGRVPLDVSQVPDPFSRESELSESHTYSEV